MTLDYSCPITASSPICKHGCGKIFAYFPHDCLCRFKMAAFIILFLRASPNSVFSIHPKQDQTR